VRKTNAEYVAMLAAQDWGGLWEAAVPWVKFAVSSFATDSREDATQEVLLHIGQMLHKWDPARGPFTQFITARARYEMMDYVRRAAGRSKTGHQKFFPSAGLTSGGDDAADADHKLHPTYEHAQSVPESFGDPAEELARVGSAAAVEALLARLEPSLALKFRERWGLPILDEEPEETQLKDIAASHSVHRDALRREMDAAQRFLRTSQKATHDTSVTSIYPPQGRDCWPQVLSAAERYPGFWHGRVNAMNDLAVWRDNVSNVWENWSWKPTDLDVFRGCKR
jgi:hypothetical protein